MLGRRIDIIPVILTAAFTLLKLWAIVQIETLIWLWILFFCFTSCIVWSIKHNHIHTPVFRSRVLNRILDFMIMLHSGTGVTSTWLIHVVNHHPNNNNDHDWTSIQRGPGLNNSLLDMVLYPFYLIPQLIVEKRNYLSTIDNSRLKTRIGTETLVMLTFIVAGFIFYPVNMLFFFLIPVLFSQWFLIVTNYLQHKNCDHESKYDHSNNIIGRFYNIILFNVGYHTAHHLKPKAHWSSLKEIHETEIRSHISSRHEKRSFLWFIWNDFIRSKTIAE